MDLGEKGTVSFGSSHKSDKRPSPGSESPGEDHWGPLMSDWFPLVGYYSWPLAMVHGFLDLVWGQCMGTWAKYCWWRSPEFIMFYLDIRALPVHYRAILTTKGSQSKLKFFNHIDGGGATCTRMCQDVLYVYRGHSRRSRVFLCHFPSYPLRWSLTEPEAHSFE